MLGLIIFILLVFSSNALSEKMIMILSNSCKNLEFGLFLLSFDIWPVCFLKRCMFTIWNRIFYIRSNYIRSNVIIYSRVLYPI